MFFYENNNKQTSMENNKREMLLALGKVCFQTQEKHKKYEQGPGEVSR